MCVCVCEHVSVCVFLCGCLCVCVCVWFCVCVCVCVSSHFVCLCVCMCICVCTHACLHMCTNIHICVCIRVYRVHYVQGGRLFTSSGTMYYHGFNLTLCNAKDKDLPVCINNVTSPTQVKAKDVHATLRHLSTLCVSTVFHEAVLPPKEKSPRYIIVCLTYSWHMQNQKAWWWISSCVSIVFLDWLMWLWAVKQRSDVDGLLVMDNDSAHSLIEQNVSEFIRKWCHIFTFAEEESFKEWGGWINHTK